MDMEQMARDTEHQEQIIVSQEMEENELEEDDENRDREMPEF